MYSFRSENNRGEGLLMTGNPNYTVKKIEGLNPPQANINKSVNATTDGSKINSVRLNDRNIVIYLAIERDVEANRIKLYKYFPVKETVRLYYSNDSRDVFIEGTVELVECDYFGKKQVAQISIICEKPYFKAVEYLITNFSDVSSYFEFPFSIDEAGMEISAITPNVRKSIVNAGDVETGVIIELFAIGTVVKPVIYDVLNKTQLALNLTLETSDRVVINTNVGEKSITLIRGGISSNAMGYLVPNSDWFTLRAGDNVYTYTTESGSSNLQIKFTTEILYSGV